MIKYRELIAGAVLMAAVLVVSAILPARFYREPQTSPPDSGQNSGINGFLKPSATSQDSIVFGSLTREERIELYNSGNTIEVYDPSGLSAQQYSDCYDKVEYVYDTLLVDRGEAVLNEFAEKGVVAEHYYYISDGNGRGIRFIEAYSSWYADWKNWFDIFIDLDTGDIYQLYYSIGCMQNRDRYLDIDMSDIVSLTEGVLNAEALEDEIVDYTDEQVSIHQITLDVSGESLTYSGTLKFHQAALIDFKLRLVK